MYSVFRLNSRTTLGSVPNLQSTVSERLRSDYFFLNIYVCSIIFCGFFGNFSLNYTNHLQFSKMCGKKEFRQNIISLFSIMYTEKWRNWTLGTFRHWPAYSWSPGASRRRRRGRYCGPASSSPT